MGIHSRVVRERERSRFPFQIPENKTRELKPSSSLSNYFSVVKRMNRVMFPMIHCLLITRASMGYSLPGTNGYYRYKVSDQLPTVYEDNHEELKNAETDYHEYPHYQIIHLNPVEIKMLEKIEAEEESRARGMEPDEEVWLEPSAEYLEYGVHPPSQTSAVLTKKDIEHLQYLPYQLQNYKINQDISFRKSPMTSDKAVEKTPEVLPAERKGMEEEAIYRPQSARDKMFVGRKKRSVPPFVRRR